ncbi:MAG: 1-deoxy-D-xylulose-5-phosphate synthase [Candidatus Thiodiazotropha lotti]|uniref:1-deoxy-D-xylulose-5-phosphate synthase n=1 Tax=Candidatus Thiodiazotropha lotti TaxID=2792787 RepID=A0A9E4N1M2_9GAMM|nr:1-deoxy-D-xylulose-5-phosphate synthase [Candidatus Thiodiazotropha lotti]MCG7921319.1 1-deoxy-D-xylulose-5-phosphate synthase [Candidatus Thiodiazotropha lotti]MCG7930284.1 1-deoxy-D-xylulose-5-phosphate synthase [Candidatus Thiodiazotropha lotti]MCG7941146.1 1-deoxy-D-xylulose-5-phosphate synthase [Candidatus Thiodiazotropha lotti]MCG8005051.1 1-deoxy-D-xylulose-5-phosphate synthase [Candidatus Thiodiazotropha lotti]
MSDQGTTGNTPKSMGDYPILSQVNYPGDLRKLDPIKLRPLAVEMRRFLIDSVAQTGGHLAAGLGVVELTIALHYVFNTPYDRLIWDVGHQAYPHKILTGRRERMGSLRKKGGLSGFPKRSESDYDAFGTGHSSTSIGAALGMAVAAKQKGENRKVVAIIGDGAMGAGMAFEALNQAGALDQDLLVILNDNDMSISEPVGGFSNHLAKLLSGKVYTSMREGGKSALSHLPHQLSDLVGKWEEHMKGMVMPGTLFEEMGFNYIGPIEGHDFDTLITTLHNMRHMRGPRLLHVVTQKGKGYIPAEQDPCVYHGVTPFDPATGKMEKGTSSKTYTQVFGDWLCHVAEQDEKLVAITPAMSEGSGMVTYAKRFPQRYFDVGIAEQHALTFAAGLACEGLKPVVAIYSTFLQRAYDQLIHDVALQNLDVTLAVDRAGQVGADGATHAGCFDLSYVRSLPNMVIMAPGDEQECDRLLQTGYEYEGPAMIRYPRGAGPGVEVEVGSAALEVGKGEIRRTGKQVALLVFGSLLATAQQVADHLDATLVNMRFIKPLDEALVREMAASHEILVTLEENVVQGGAGSAVNEFLAAKGIQVNLINLGLPDRYLDHASHQEQLTEAGLDYAGILSAIERVSRSSKLRLV